MIRRNQHITGSIGRLKDTVTIQVQSITTDSTGGQDATWNDVINRFALVEPMALSERVQAESVIGEVSHRITMRELTRFEAERFTYLQDIARDGSWTVKDATYYPDADFFTSFGVIKLGAVLGYTNTGRIAGINAPEFRLIWRGRPLSIQSVIDMGNVGDYVQLMCREVTP